MAEHGLMISALVAVVAIVGMVMVVNGGMTGAPVATHRTINYRVSDQYADESSVFYRTEIGPNSPTGIGRDDNWEGIEWQEDYTSGAISECDKYQGFRTWQIDQDICSSGYYITDCNGNDLGCWEDVYDQLY